MACLKPGKVWFVNIDATSNNNPVTLQAGLVENSRNKVEILRISQENDK